MSEVKNLRSLYCVVFQERVLGMVSPVTGCGEHHEQGDTGL